MDACESSGPEVKARRGQKSGQGRRADTVQSGQILFDQSDVPRKPHSKAIRMSNMKSIQRRPAADGNGGDRRPACSAGSTSLLEAYASAKEVGVEHGDAVFEHPFVQDLLSAAKARVLDALSKVPGKPENKWLVCVRTYGRPGQHESWSQLRRFLVKIGKSYFYERFYKAGIDIKALRKACKNPGGLNKLLRDAGQKTIPIKGLEQIRSQLDKPIPKVRPSDAGLQDMTLAALERALGPQAYRRCLIFVSHEDTAVVSGQYAKSLEGTPWASRIVLGVKGAHFQVRFIEEAFPAGSHVIIADDNIQSFVVEEPSLQMQQKAKDRRDPSFARRHLELGPWRGSLHGTNLSVVEESEIHTLIRGTWPRWSSERMNAMEQRFIDAGLSELPKLTTLLAPSADLNSVLCEAGQAPLTPVKLRELRVRLDTPLPERLLFAVENVSGLIDVSSSVGAVGSKTNEFASVISRAGHEMERTGANTWGLSQTKNHYFLFGFGEDVRRRAIKKGLYNDVKTKLGLIYGAFFGLRVLHDRSRYTRFGQVKDDVERSLRYWHLDGILLRFARYGIEKAHKPGQFHEKKGGISAASSATDHESEGTRALQGMLDEFASPYVRFPNPGERTSNGLVWNGVSYHHPLQAKPSPKFVLLD